MTMFSITAVDNKRRWLTIFLKYCFLGKLLTLMTTTTAKLNKLVKDLVSPQLLPVQRALWLKGMRQIFLCKIAR